MEKETLRFVIVGHVDHGKSTLIGRLLFDTNSLPEGKLEEVKAICKSLGRELEFAFVMDNFQEEREQNVTIDTTQTFFKTDKRNYVIIDAPGHVEFVKNMITGASQAEAALLIVDAKEGVQEQTRRHAYVLSLLGLKQVVVLINKMDLVDYKQEHFASVCSDLLKFLKSVNVTPSHIIPISAKEGFNVAKKSAEMKWYDGPTVLEALDTFAAAVSLSNRSLRFPVQDVYKIEDKRILVGRIESGTLKTGADITFYPTHSKSTIKSLELFGENRGSAEAGESIGITLTHPLFIERGEVGCVEGSAPKTTKQFFGNVFWMSKVPLNTKENILLRCSTQEIECTLAINKRFNSSTLEILEASNSLQNNEVAEAVITVKKPVAVDKFSEVEEMGRFVLVKDNDVVAGGIITGF